MKIHLNEDHDNDYCVTAGFAKLVAQILCLQAVFTQTQKRH